MPIYPYIIIHTHRGLSVFCNKKEFIKWGNIFLQEGSIT